MKSPFDPKNQLNDIDSKIIAGLERISEAFRVLIWNRIKNLTISPLQFQILIFIDSHSKDLATVGHLAREFNMTPATISDAVSSLEQKKLVKRLTNINDKRSYIFQPTAKGKRLLKDSKNFLKDLEKSISTLEYPEKENFLMSILKIIFSLYQNGVITQQRMCLTCRYYSNSEGSMQCKLLGIKLNKADLRVDCPEHESIEEN